MIGAMQSHKSEIEHQQYILLDDQLGQCVYNPMMIGQGKIWRCIPYV